MPVDACYRADPRYLELGEGFADPVTPAEFPRRTLRFRNDAWASRVGLAGLAGDEWERHFARFAPLPGNLEAPLAMRYHGHQFMSYNPGLGDGRGFLFAQLRDAVDGRLLDLGTKGSGTTPYSRGGDGRLTLKGGVRELLATEQLEALGVTTSKTLSLYETGEALHRGDEPSPTRSSVLVRLSHSHLRYGSFQYHAYHRDARRLAALVEHARAYYLPEVTGSDIQAQAIALLAATSRRAGVLCAQWMVAGFVHGVLNTDNMNLTGESFDYGPYRLLPTYDLGFTAAYFDHTGLYCYGRQPHTALWNLERLADCLLPLGCSEGALGRALTEFEPAFIDAVGRGFLERLGVASRGADEDAALVDACYAYLGASACPLDRFFFDWYGGVASERRALAGPGAAGYRGDAFAELRGRLDPYEPRPDARLDDPYFAGDGPCSLLIDEIEAIWAAIAERDDWAPLERKVASIRRFAALHGRGLGRLEDARELE
ncbi:MAG: YdiU family protein [Myxococcales bacterium]|nr:YdiU family protein [Myxococcales bacterium]